MSNFVVLQLSSSKVAFDDTVPVGTRHMQYATS